MVKQLQSCCCGCSLRTGTIIIGFLQIFTSAYMIGEAIFKPPPPTNSQQDIGHVDITDGPRSMDKILENAIADGVFAQVMKAILGCINLILAIMLTVGAQKNNPKLVYPWIIVNVVINSLSVIVFLVVGILVAVYGQVAIGISFIVGLILGFLLFVYLVLVVNSYHTTIMNERPQDYTLA